ncbi:MAG: sulfur carrier protein ThiS [Elusimicrobia bacterium]|nr:sulfur carrier protein ThiS [Elusimicrobiota bacterium]
MKIKLNGKETDLEKPLTMQELLKKMQIKPEMVACEVNLKIIKRSEFNQFTISEGDHIEILQMIGGG